ncbi:hypothetical protein POKO110462_22655 [Pontibacter korlensis]
MLFSLCCWFALLTSERGAAQSFDVFNAEKRLTPSPTAASLGSYGGMNVKKSTGGIGKSIPLFQLQQGAISYAPTLEYFSTGTRVNDWGGQLGIGWTDSFTGVIQRTVRGVPDEYASQRGAVTPDRLTGYTQEGLDYLEEVYVGLENSAGHDSEYDVFSFNVFGQSGDFIIKDGEALLLNHQQGVSIEVLSTFPYTFTLTNSDGTKYSFGINSDIEYTQYDNDNACDDGANPNPSLPTAWFLSKVESPYNDVVHFTYNTVSYSYMYDYNEFYDMKNGIEAGDGFLNDNSHYTYFASMNCSRYKVTTTKYLVAVTGLGFSLAFNYDDRQDLYGAKLLKTVSLYGSGGLLKKQASLGYDKVVSTKAMEPQLAATISASEDLGTLKTRYFLTSLEIGGSDGLPVQKYGFSYISPEELPHRFSFSQDLVGYYNAKGGQGFTPAKEADYFLQYESGGSLLHWKSYVKTSDRTPGAASRFGMLNEVVYPTGGTESIVYEQNTYTTTKEVLEPATQEEFFVNNNPNLTEITSEAIRVPYGQEVRLSVYTGYANGEYPYDNDGSLHRVEFQLWDVTNNRVVWIPGNNSSGIVTRKLYEQYIESISLSPDTDYELRASLYGEGTTLEYILNYSSEVRQVLVDEPYYGQRVKQVTTNSLYSPPIVKAYSYKSFDQVEHNLVYSEKTSSHISNERSGFGSYYYTEIYEPCGQGSDCLPSPRIIKRYRLSSKSRFDISPYGGFHIIYSCVTEFQDQGSTSFIASEYTVESNEATTRIIGDFTPSVPMTNIGWTNGLESKRYHGSLTDGEYSIAKEQAWFYSGWITSPQTINNYVVHRAFKPSATYNDMEMNYAPYTVYLYPLYSRWYQLTSVSEKHYFADGQTTSTVSSTTSYSYNEKDKLLAEEETTSSRGESLTKRLRRPRYMIDAGLDPQGVYQAMVGKNMLTPVVEEIHLNNNRQLSLTRTNYYSPHTGIYAPAYVETQVEQHPAEIRFRYHGYDEQGNVLSASAADGPTTCYVWGYGGQKLIAKVDNIPYATLASVLGGEASIRAFRDRLHPTDAEVESFLAPLRTATSLAEAMVTTFTYDPLVGMSSAADPNNVRTYFIYDSFGRLAHIKDNAGNITNMYDYHYQGEGI